MRDVSRLILESIPDEAVRMVPCQITGTAPLTVSFNGGPGIPAAGIAGVTYSTGAGVAFVSPGRVPVVLRLA